jgi:hypothetical protein
MKTEKEAIDSLQRADIRRVEALFASIDPLTACTLNYAKQLLKYSPVHSQRTKAIELLKEVLNLALDAKQDGPVFKMPEKKAIKTIEKRGT